MLITLEDPKGGVGSGGATLNALLVVTEHLSAKAGFRVCININGYEFFLKNVTKEIAAIKHVEIHVIIKII